MAIDPVSAMTIASGVISGAQTIGNGIYGMVNDKYNKAQNEWNKNFAREQFNYQKDLNKMIMEREDTAVQRRVEDLKAAGISKNMAVGQSASAQVLGAGNSGAVASQGQYSKGFERQILDQSLIKNKKEMESIDTNRNLMESEESLNKQKENESKAIASMYESEADYYDSMTASNKHNLDYAKFWKMPTGLSAKASNKYELLSSFGQFLLKGIFDGFDGKNIGKDNTVEQFKQYLNDSDISEHDKKILLNKFKENREHLLNDLVKDPNYYNPFINKK